MEQFRQQISSAVDLLRLDILMQYYPRLGSGTAALRWSDPMDGGPPVQAHLIALLYGHILSTHPEHRDQLFARVGRLALQNVRSKGASGFEFAPWVLHADWGCVEQTIWPWVIVPPEQLTEPKVYTAILKFGKPTTQAPSGRWLELEVTSELERVFAPSSVLIAITGFANSCEPQTRYLLARLLWQMNQFWGSPNMVSLFNEAVAYAAADAAIRSSPFRIP